MSPLTAEDSTPKAATTTANAAAITATVAVVLHCAAMLRRPTVLPRRGSHLYVCRGIRACLRIVPQRMQRVLRERDVASPDMGHIWIVMGAACGVSRGGDDAGVILK